MQEETFALLPDIGAELIEAAGGEHFGPLLLAAARRCCDVEELFAYGIGEDRRPFPLARASRRGDNDERVDSYLAGYFNHDPLLHRYRDARRGSCFSDLIRTSEISLSAYRARCFSKPAFAEKLSFGWQGPQQTLVLSFYSRQPHSIIPERLASVAGLALSALHQRRTTRDAGDLLGKVEQRLRLRLPQLTLRERQICARTITGESAQAIGEAFAISTASVATYRRRAYAKCGIHSAAELLSFILN